MRHRKIKFVAGSAIIFGAVGLLAISGFEESKAYYQTVIELKAMGPRSEGARFRVGGNVVPGTIVRREGAVEFQISQEGQVLDVRYVGRAPLPDTLVDDSQALLVGYLLADGTFEASTVQAKCASKYEAEYGATSEDEPGK